mmetsp:Transcript_2682/g.4011  ORF Transcript_2682/g.4011 Transcript_2682/m.4011 type:complete len:146 (-) Transcript_2682:115-552(-)
MPRFPKINRLKKETSKFPKINRLKKVMPRFPKTNRLKRKMQRLRKKAQPKKTEPKAEPKTFVKKTKEEKEKIKKMKEEKRLLAAQLKRQKTRTFDQALDDQFVTGRLLACISSRPGQSGRADGYILEGKELEFYSKLLSKKKGKR